MGKVFIERQQDIVRMALTDKETIQELYIEEINNEPKVGQIYVGIIKNIVPSINSIFIDIGFEKNCYMKLNKKNNNQNIKVGNYIIVQVMKESSGSKGARVTSELSISGRYVVINNFSKNKVIFSKQICDEEFKKYVLENMVKLEDAGIILRTKSQHANIENINYEIQKLYNTFKKVISIGNVSLKPKLLYSPKGIVNLLVKDILDESIDSIVVNSIEDYDYINEHIRNYNLNCELKIHNQSQSVFEAFGIERQIMRLKNNRVDLKSGAYINIDKTEAMYVIDVNSGSNITNSSLKKTAFAINMEAAQEICRQIKLRNLSGIIIVDFIDIKSCKYRNLILDVLRQNIVTRHRKAFVYPFTQLNLVQISRERKGKEISSYLEEKCSICNGSGSVLNFSYVKFLIKNEINRISKSYNNIQDIYIEIDANYKKHIIKDIYKFIKDIGAENKKVYVKYLCERENTKVEPLLFSNQIKSLYKYKIYG